jgi:hypothetical protein
VTSLHGASGGFGSRAGGTARAGGDEWRYTDENAVRAGAADAYDPQPDARDDADDAVSAEHDAVAREASVARQHAARQKSEGPADDGQHQSDEQYRDAVEVRVHQ